MNKMQRLRKKTTVCHSTTDTRHVVTEIKIARVLQLYTYISNVLDLKFHTGSSQSQNGVFVN